MNKWFWAWRALKYGEHSEVREDHDEEVVRALIENAFTNTIPRGDGKFSRLVNYVEAMHDSAQLAKANFTGNDEVLLAFLLGLEVSFELTTRMAEKIKERH